MGLQKTFLVFGGTGQTGQHFVSLALKEGHKVKALARNPAKFTFKSPDLEIHPGAVSDISHLDELVQGADFVVSMLGDREMQKHAKINTAFVQNLVPAMRRKGLSGFSTRPVP